MNNNSNNIISIKTMSYRGMIIPFDANVDKSAIEDLTLILSKYIKLDHHIIRETGNLITKIDKGDLEKKSKNLEQKLRKRFSTIKNKKFDQLEYKIEGQIDKDNVILDILVKDKLKEEEGYREFKPQNSKCLEKIAKDYIKEARFFRKKKVDMQYIDDSIRFWEKDLGLSKEASQILSSNVKKNLVEYFVRETPFAGVPLYFMPKTSKIITLGHKYKRNPNFLAGISLMDMISPLIDTISDFFSFSSKEILTEKPSQIDLFVSPFFGKYTKRFSVRQAFIYAAYDELLNPNSILYNQQNEEYKKKAAYESLKELYIDYQIDKRPRPTDLSEDLFSNNTLETLVNEDVLSNDFKRSIIATTFYLTKDLRKSRLHNSMCRSSNEHLKYLMAPPIFSGVIKAMVPSLSFIPAYFAFPLALAVSGGLAYFGYGSFWVNEDIKRKISSCKTPLEELHCIATLGQNG